MMLFNLSLSNFVSTNNVGLGLALAKFQTITAVRTVQKYLTWCVGEDIILPNKLHYKFAEMGR